MASTLKPRMPSYKRLYKSFEDGLKMASYAEKEWRGLVEHMIELGTMNARRGKIVDRLVREYVEYEFNWESVTKEGLVKYGPKGEFYPMARAALDKTKINILKLEEALKIPPQKETLLKIPEKKKTAADEFL